MDVHLNTKRLILRPMKLDDATVVQKLAGNKAVADTTLNIPYPYPDGAAEQWIATHEPSFKLGTAAIFAITLKTTKEIVGAVGLTVNKEFNNAELGYWIAKDFWNQGFCTEASEILLEFAFNNLNLHKIHARHLTRNPASGKVMCKIGMVQEGILREHVKKWDKYEDEVIYGILKTDWEKLSK